MNDMGFFDDEELPDFNSEAEVKAALVLDGDSPELTTTPLKTITIEQYQAGLVGDEIDWSLPWKERVPTYTWAALCLELALLDKGFGIGQELDAGVDAVEFILKAYGAMSSDLPSMVRQEEFKRCYDEAVAQVEATGDNAGFILRNRAVAEKALSVMAQQLSNGRVGTKEVLAIFEATSKRGRLDPPKEEFNHAGLTLTFTMSDAVQPQIAEEDLPRISVAGMKPIFDEAEIIEHEADSED